jgi:hypothetical protein
LVSCRGEGLRPARRHQIICVEPYPSTRCKTTVSANVGSVTGGRA